MVGHLDKEARALVVGYLEVEARALCELVVGSIEALDEVYVGLWTWGGEPPHPPGGGEVVRVVSRVGMLPSGSLIAGVGLLAKTPILGSRALSTLTDLHLIPGTLLMAVDPSPRHP